MLPLDVTLEGLWPIILNLAEKERDDVVEGEVKLVG